ncbi:hypothetical protein [Aliiroseovarius sp. F20344]|uniref:hypothetical protein n=1 Tax=Aliiroseovarius sp. F20344 TaxID=2926414 RepID=UPI001FF5EED7|nr:hypothetical protein [Aliiroseovarius sp. F20344]MCK0143680.1 hypothetical protein [Aliiroseovarius sp. F20344]
MSNAICIRPHYTLLGLSAFVALASPITAETVPTEDEMVFEIICDFDRSFSDESEKPKERNDVRVIASTSKPELIDRNHDSFEVQSYDGARHFISPYVGGVLRGIHTTIYKDGTGVRVTQSVFSDGVHVSVETGKCEVNEK